MKNDIQLFLIVILVLLFSCKAFAQSVLPKQIDHSNTNYFPPIFNQGNIGSCDWFAVVYYQMTFLYNKQYNRTVAKDNTFSPKFGYNILNNAADFPFNIRVDDVYKFVMKHGSATMADFPYDLEYKSWCTNAETWQKALEYRIADYSFFTLNNEAPGANYSFNNFTEYFHEIKRLLNNGEVLVIQSNTFSKDCKFKTIANDPSTSEDDRYTGENLMYIGNYGPDHTIAVVGYNDYIWADLNSDGIVQENEKGALKIADSNDIEARNHNMGFLWMAYSTVESSIFQHRVNKMTIRNNYKPEIIATITLNSAERDKIKFQFGRTKSNQVKDIPINDPNVFDPYGLGYSVCTAGVSLIEGGKCAFNGGNQAMDATFVFDLTDIYQNNSKDFWYLKIENNSDQSVIIKNFEISLLKKNKVVKDNDLPYSFIHKQIYRFLKF